VTPAEHIAQAEDCLKQAENIRNTTTFQNWMAARSQAHSLLAIAKSAQSPEHLAKALRKLKARRGTDLGLA
jgi:hypothetical protein